MRRLLASIPLGFLAAIGVVLALTARASSGEQRQQASQPPTTLKAAVDVVCDQLKRDGKPKYAALLSEQQVKDAIRSAVRSYEATMDEQEKRNAGTKAYFETEVKPVCLRIADEGVWPTGCSFTKFYTLTDRRHGGEIAYDGLGLRIEIVTPKSPHQGFALPIVDLFFGRFAQ